MKTDAFLKSAPGKLIRTSRGYWTFVPNPLPPKISWSAKLVSLHSEAEGELARLSQAGKDFPQPYILTRPFTRYEAVISSRIEGTRATLEDVYAYEAEQMSFLKPSSDAREVYNYVRALEYGLERVKTFPISLRLIREMHKKLMEGVRGEVMAPGEFRRSQNWIGPAGCTLETAVYIPPPVEEMHVALDLFEKFIHAPSDLPALTRIGLIHYQFEAIHPFLDGNGRVGRLLISILLCQWNLMPSPLLYLSAYFERKRSEYYQWLLTISQRGDWEGWLTFFLTGIRDQSIETGMRIQTIQKLRERYRSQLASKRSAKRLMKAVDFLIGHPMITVRELQKGLGVTDFKTAQRYVNVLVEAGILREVTGHKRNRLFRVDEVIEAIVRPIETE
ncbi:MAG: Fic family protein [Anaerolineales bacterium]